MRNQPDALALTSSGYDTHIPVSTKISLADLERSIAAIECLKTLDLRTTPYEEVKRILQEEMRYIFTGTCYLPEGTPLFRARMNPPGAIFADARDISYRPEVEQIVDFGRAHRPHKSVFYASSDPDTALYEVSNLRRENDPTTGEDYVTVGLWETTIKLCLFPVVHAPEAIVHNPMLEPIFNNLEMAYKSLGSDRHALVNIFCGYFAREFSKLVTNVEEYKIGCALYDLVIESGNWPSSPLELPISGCIYPSVAKDLRGLNIALEPRVADAALSLREVHVKRVRKDETFVSFVTEKKSTAILPDSSFLLEPTTDPLEVFITVKVY